MIAPTQAPSRWWHVRAIVAASAAAALAVTVPGPAADAAGPMQPSHRFSTISSALDGGHVCAATTDGHAACWGRNDHGQLGTGDTTPTFAPVAVTHLPSGVKQIAAGAMHTCALGTGGAVRCWGFGADGELGNGRHADSAVPVDVLDSTGKHPLTGAIEITAGAYHSCALLNDGGIDCWGLGKDGQLGNHAADARALPEAVKDRRGKPLAQARSVSAGEAHSCAVLADRTVDCWGDDSSGQLGDGHSEGNSLMPVPVAGLSEVMQVSAGKSHTCAVTAIGLGFCWGADELGQLGRGMHGWEFDVPQQVAASSPLSSIAAGQMYTCATTTSGGAQCWGDASYGELGDGLPFGTIDTPQLVLGLPARATAITAGAITSCAVVSGGAALCWGGANTGGGNALGNGDRIQDDRLVAFGVA